jgi:hypothetical protein
MTHHAQAEQRAAIIGDARRLLDWLEANPDVPVWSWGLEILCGMDGGRAGVDRIAELISEQPEQRPSGSYRATKSFGRAAYVAYAAAIPDTRAAA